MQSDALSTDPAVVAAGAAGALGVVLELAGDGAAAGVGGAAGLGAAVAVLVLVDDPVTARPVNAVDLGRSERSRWQSVTAS